ncbi:cadmium-translocating P-type ATPase [Noviherbaspirillum sp. 17J57-3]|uniref:P-type Zn(2+) transporter n=2 Tax=Noviherbaspirillum galbum TaxID=2709383 RepID=A0A6B3SRF1_9BURK|nr:cadmium-translocating P-type ATPase [Noviherbaspirillum galbum]
MSGIGQLGFNLMTRVLTVSHQPGQQDAIMQALKTIGMHAEPMSATAAATAPFVLDSTIEGAQLTQYRIENMDCPTEERLIRNKLEGLAGVVQLDFNLMNRVLGVHHRLESQASVLAALKAIGMQAEPLRTDAPANADDADASPLKSAQKILLVVSGLTAAAAEALAWSSHSDSSPLVIALAIISIVTGGLPTLRKGWIALKTFTLNINFLMSLAVFGAVAIGQWPEAAMVIFLFAVAELIESLSLNRARNAVHGLMQLTPETASMQSPDGSWPVVPTDSVPVGALFRVKPGERIPLDGVVKVGESTVNQAPITGESMPVDKRVGDTVYAGTINQQGLLDVEVTANSGGSTLSRIVRVIQETQGNQAPTQRFVDKFAHYYTPAVVAIAVLVAVVPPLAFSAPFAEWLYKALVMLVIACPCALVISTPVTVVSGLTAATRRGILIKGGEFLEAGHKLKAIAVDKTGTLTQGQPGVTSVKPFGDFTPEQLLLLAASLNAHSDHPLARAIVKAGPPEVALKPVTGFEALPGRGVKGQIDGVTYYLGNHRLMEELGRCSPQIESVLDLLEVQAQTAVVLSSEQATLGVIAIADVLRPNVPRVINALNNLGVATVMLTGDNAKTAKRIAELVGIAEFKGELLPEDKLTEVKQLQSKYGTVGMVGDGVNDAPALAQAQIGFAMGAAGSDTAIETADVALMDDDLGKLPVFIELSRATRRILMQNIAVALGIKVLFFAMALGGVATLWMAVFADVGASMLVMFNGLRLLGFKRQV